MKRIQGKICREAIKGLGNAEEKQTKVGLLEEWGEAWGAGGKNEKGEELKWNV